MPLGLKDLSLEKKLWLVAAAAGLVSAMFSGVLIIGMAWRAELEEIAVGRGRTAAVVAESVSDAVERADLGRARALLAGLRHDRDVVLARIVDRAGQEFARYERTAAGEQVWWPSEPIVVRADVMAGERSLGTFELVHDPSGVLDRQLRRLVLGTVLAAVMGLALGGIVIVRLRHFITVPLTELNRLVQDVSGSADWTRRTRVSGMDEVGRLGASLNRMIAQIGLRTSALQNELEERGRAQERLVHQAHHDPVTGLPNRHFFHLHTAELAARSATAGEVVALLFIDLDDFKRVNDRFGHESGDLLLAAVGARLKGCLRAKDLVVRFGGDEFLVLLGLLESEVQADEVAHKLLATLVQPFVVGGTRIDVTCSIGIACASAQSADFDTLRQRADVAMYAAKSSGKNGIRCWSPQLHAASPAAGTDYKDASSERQ